MSGVNGIRGRRALVVGFLLATAGAVATQPAHAQGGGSAAVAGQTEFDIPAQAVTEALIQFGRQSGMKVSADASMVSGTASPGVRGTMAPARALSSLLTGTGLTFRISGNTVTIERAPRSIDGAISLGPVRVEGSGEAGGSERAFEGEVAITEGTGSYTTPATTGGTGLTLSIRQTPQSVAVITNQRLQDQRLQTLAEVMANAPGITVSQLDSERTGFAARGMSIDQLQYDGISTPYDIAFTDGQSEISPVIYDRVEILRGATGLLSGPGSPSASVNLIRKHADSRVFTGEVYVSGGSWNNYQGVVDVTAPLNASGSVRARTVLAYQDKDFFIDNYSRQAKVAYGVIDADLAPSTKVSLGISYQDNDTDGVTYGGQPTFFSDGRHTEFRRSFSSAPKWAYENTSALNAFLDIKQQLGKDWLAKLTLLHGEYKVDNARLFIYGLPDPDTGVVAGEYGGTRIKLPGERKQNSGDLRISGPFELFGRRHEAIFGFSYYKQKSYYDRIAAIPEWEDISVYDIADAPEPSWADPVQSFNGEVTQTAGFATVRLSLADPLTAIIGGRYTRVHRKGSWYAGTTPFDSARTRFVPYAGLVYDVSKQLSVYASFTSIFNPQESLNRNREYLEPVTGDTYEAGVKGEFAGGRLNASAAVFRTRQNKLSEYEGEFEDPATGDFFSAYRPVDTVSKGFEFDINGEPLAGWRVYFNLSHFSLKGANGQDVNTSTPRTSANLFTTYSFGRITLGGGARWQSRIYAADLYPADFDNGGVVSQPAYLVANLMGRYDFGAGWSAQANINNLFDKKYETAVNFYGQRVWGTPRSFLITAKKDF